MNKKLKSTLIIALAGIAIVAAIAAWWALRPAGLPAGIVSGNGRIEATEIDIATKTPGRVVDILAREGDFVQAGAVLARKCCSPSKPKRRPRFVTQRTPIKRQSPLSHSMRANITPRRRSSPSVVPNSMPPAND